MTQDDITVLEAVESVYAFYANELKGMVDLVELHYDAIPDGMLSEIRSMTGHLCDATIRKDMPCESRLENVRSAETHMRRVYLDCFKLMCIWYRNYISRFEKKFFFIDWQNITDGDFIRELSIKRNKAKNEFKEAKKLEKPGKNDRDRENDNLGEVYELYMRAYNSYLDVYDYIENNLDKVERSAHNDRRKSFLSKLGWLISFVLAVISIILAVI
jgi:hypothetical protein